MHNDIVKDLGNLTECAEGDWIAREIGILEFRIASNMYHLVIALVEAP